ncbi:substrate-binding periplasmic protein [Kordiimonas sp.]|uniref:substrate-binding periplasmic protein n=1 Tax=Kordiimonas sp. TaxID=1970157 RepID=UPI003A8DC08E
MVRNWVKHITLGIAAALVASGQVYAAQCEEIVATGHPDYVPISWQKGDVLVGAAPDLLDLISKEIGVPIRTVHSGGWKRAQSQVFAGELDMIASLYRTAEREAKLEYTSAFSNEPVVVITLVDTDIHYRDRDNLIPYQGGMVIGDSLGQDLDEFSAASLKLHTVPSVDHLLNLLDHKRIQYAIHGLYPVMVAAHKLGIAPRIRTHVPPLSQESMHLAISKKSSCLHLLPQISAAIEKLRAAGTVDQLLKANWSRWAKTENIGAAPPDVN